MRQAASGADLATKPARNDEVGVSRLALLAVLGLGCGKWLDLQRDLLHVAGMRSPEFAACLLLSAGFLIFNFQHILAISHIHISLAHSHRTTAFCAFAGCKLGQGDERQIWQQQQ